MGANVAPYAGAWIEILNKKILNHFWLRSLPTRERGLKLFRLVNILLHP